MGNKKQKICSWRKKDIQNNLQLFIDIVQNPTHVCMKCGRVANSADRLCKAEEIVRRGRQAA
ncbi:hypothetical protein [Dethiosulfatarculus sandiegensis]|uniref:Uncharacterized protein n=1 Tax=Dethiosulfatarculus sandiegensis TaxID=1429043 RepID=A0A0D2J7Y3_9BACT|nr:hypothetical protein [Dethiosulfatarculus sandiegensis]KIX14304.1 hypothetical protein X474_10290 [Dethiosulfatarculus sandiegensis]